MKSISNLINHPIFSGIGLVGFTMIIITFFTFSKTGNESNDSDTQYMKGYAIYMLSLPTNVNFAGEEAPLQNFDIRENLDRELHVNTYWHSQTIILLKRANRYFPIIEKILKEYNIPDDFKYIALIESGLINTISPSRATGYWQFLEGTAKDYGLEVNDQIDERYHIEKSTEAACKYFLKSYEKYKNWTMVAASYNMGRRNLDTQIERQKTNYYYDLLLGEETERYLFRILAFKYIFENPAVYGFQIQKKKLYQPLSHYYIKIDTSINDFADFAYQHSINYKTLKYFNPWLRDNKLDNSAGKEYIIKIPKKGLRSFNKEAVIRDSAVTVD